MRREIAHRARFQRSVAKAPAEARLEAKKAFQQFQVDPRHPGLQFKKVVGKHGEEYWSVRVSSHYRALGYIDQGEIYWFFIGTHAEYDKLLA